MFTDISFLKAVTNATYCGLIIADTKGMIVVCNRTAKKLAKWENRNIIGKHLKEVLPDIWPEYQKILKYGITQLGLKTERVGFTMLVNRAPIIFKDKIVGLVSIFQDISELQSQLRKSQRLYKESQSKLRKIQIQQEKFDGIVAYSKQMQKVLELANRVAPIDIPVLLEGETGTGKDVIAKLIHKMSGKSKTGMFMRIDCGAIPDNLLESELFGYEKGAFTGANQNGKKGLFELAQKGTLFLDDIDAFPLNLQVKLLNAVQNFHIMRVGGTKRIKFNARIITSSNGNLYQMVKDRTFRKDLFFRLNVVSINIPPLREREGDIIPLINHFLNKFNKKYKMKRRLTRSVIDYLIQYKWPGNVRELEHLIERLIVITEDNDISSFDLPTHIIASKKTDLALLLPSKVSSLKYAVSNFESQLIREAIDKCGNVKKAAKILKVDPSTIGRKLNRNHLTGA